MSSFNDALKFTGDVYITKTDTLTGKVENIEYKNLVVNAGKTHIASRMSANTVNVMSHMAVGTGNTAAAAGDTTLNTELARVALSVTGGTASSNTITYAATFPAGTGTGALTEAGVFNAASSGTMMCRTVFPVINKQAADVIAVSWVVSIT